MTPDDIRSIRRQLRLTQAGLARLLHLSPARGGRSIREYELSERTPSGPTEIALRAIATFGPPETWPEWRPDPKETDR